MAKRIKIDRVIHSCENCIYTSYNSDYNISYDSGYDCIHSKAPHRCRIVDDWDVQNSNNPNPAGWPKIPDWCPLEDEKE